MFTDMYATITSGVRKALGLVVLLAVLQDSTAQQTAPKKDTVAVSKLQVTGTIRDAATGKGIVGARISLPNVSASITDASGSFKVTVPTYFEDLMVSAEGYDTKQIPLKGRKHIEVALLDESYNGLQDPLTSPLATAPIRNTTTASSRIQLDGAWTRPMETLDGLLQGQIAGLNSTRRSGTPGVGANLFLRGYNSLYGTNKPLVIVDGMIYDVNDYG